MYNKVFKITLLIIGLTFYTSYGQADKYFSFTAGTNILDNSNGKDAPWDVDRIDFKKPFFVEVERRFNESFSLALMGTSNSLQLPRLNEAGDGFTNEYYDFMAVNLSGKYFLDQLVFDNDNIDLYVGAGAGYHDVAEGNAITANLNVGFNYWITNRLGVSIQAVANKGFNDEVLYVGNYYQYNLGVSYRFKSKASPKKKKSVKGESQIKLVPDTQEEVPVVKESTLGTPKPIVKKVPVVKEVDEAQLRLDALRAELAAFGPIYFDKNSSYFTAPQKAKLKAITAFLNANSFLILRIDGYTDATGTEAYNMFISDRRLKRVVDYVTANGVSVNRIEGVSNGVDPNNTCNASHTNCDEATHASQRRVEFTIKN